ncbi:hypothetical protein BDD43_5436 [Mucilaginibacter gracilis]|uniref:Uncharacterized protein n=1 Tax=Mucilaginibacter gracilis TaxID=423350 RepID=A0A495J872_9SPHI|nr:hypothetical protein [Mucilaginibacter gracilis]RKR85175.1 hypothetical protein BDD43_5436 [Mucilaginibacter gracilis]
MAKKSDRKLNELGEYLAKRSINKSEVCRKTGIHPTRMTWLCYESITFLKAYELQLIAMSIKVAPSEMQNDLFGNLKLKEDNKNISEQERLNIQIINLLKVSNNSQNEIITDIKAIERIGKIITFCMTSKTEAEILNLISLKRKSHNFIALLKACVQINWLTQKQTKEEGKVIKTYTTTEYGRLLLENE